MPIGRGDNYGKRYKPQGFGELGRFAGGPNGAMANFLYPLAHRDVVYWRDDFDQDTINLDYYTVDIDAGGTNFAVPATRQVNGVIVGATDNTDNDGAGIAGVGIWSGDNNCGMEVRLKMDVVTDLQLELGFANIITDQKLPVVTDVDTPASGNGGTDIAVFHIDTDQTLTTMAFVTDGSTSNMNCTATTLSPVFTPTADTYHVYKIQLAGDQASAMVDGARLVSHGALIGSRIEGGSLLRPFVFFRNRSAAVKTCTIDYIRVWQDRAVRTA